MKGLLKVIGWGVLVLLAVSAVLLFTPVLDPDLSSHPKPLGSYEAAAQRIGAIKAAESSAVLIPEASSIALLTGSRTETSVVIFHGYTSVPRQFRLIAEGYRAMGYNVWVPRLPYHGERDRMTTDMSKLTAQGLRGFADQNIDIGAGLGKHVIVIGLSGGGSLATWSAVDRPEVSQTVLISPLLHPLGFAEWEDRPLVRALRILPFDLYNWWDPVKQDSGPHGYEYPRYSLKGIAALLSLAHWTDKRAETPSGKAQSPVLMIRNDGDQRLDVAYNERFANRMAAPGRLTMFRIPKSAGLLHNFVSPEPNGESHAHITEAYRYLSEALGILLPDPLAPHAP